MKHAIQCVQDYGRWYWETRIGKNLHNFHKFRRFLRVLLEFCEFYQFCGRKNKCMKGFNEFCATHARAERELMNRNFLHPKPLTESFCFSNTTFLILVHEHQKSFYRIKILLGKPFICTNQWVWAAAPAPAVKGEFKRRSSSKQRAGRRH